MSSGESTSDPVARTVAFAKTTFESVRAKLGAMSKPARVMLVSTIAAAIVLTSYVGYRSSETTWGTLFANLERDDAAAVMAKLKEMKGKGQGIWIAWVDSVTWAVAAKQIMIQR